MLVEQCCSPTLGAILTLNGQKTRHGGIIPTISPAVLSDTATDVVDTISDYNDSPGLNERGHFSVFPVIRKLT
ncbi:hypothetical protein [Candidatus Hamiltonella defensa]|uniref:hypothetical protein n=2 Tax=Candidatus Williamhamiltonella defendens TaxID=138072 RepID=UPI0012FD2D85|nr:hypothetical protein [Candidatus Hamiltonella defensa]